MLQHFEHSGAVEAAIREWQPLRVAAHHTEPLDAAAPDGLQMAEPSLVSLDSGNRQGLEGIQQRSKEYAPPRAEIDEAFRRKPAQDAEYSPHMRQI